MPKSDIASYHFYFLLNFLHTLKGDAYLLYKSNHRRRSVKKGALKNFANFTRKQMCWSLFLIKMQACLCWSLFLTPTQMFYCEICEIFKNTYFEEHVRTIASVSAKYKET